LTNYCIDYPNYHLDRQANPLQLESRISRDARNCAAHSAVWLCAIAFRKVAVSTSSFLVVESELVAADDHECQGYRRIIGWHFGQPIMGQHILDLLIALIFARRIMTFFGANRHLSHH